MSLNQINLAVFGDNILECERMVELISNAFPDLTNQEQNLESIYAPLKRIYNENFLVNIQLYPDYKSNDRWGEKGILDLLAERGAKLTEAPDIILTKSDKNIETIILAIEFSSAIPAGNQAWQRSGRALSFSEVFIPYLYITDIGLEELDDEREAKAVRESNPLVPLSYIKHSQRSNTFTYMVLNPSYLLENSTKVQQFIVKDEVLQIIRAIVLNEDTSKYERKLEQKIANYLDRYKNVPKSISFPNWIEKKDSEIESFIKSFHLKKYNKIIAKKTPIKDEMRAFIKDIIPDYALSIYNNLPICFVPGSQRLDLTHKVRNESYSSLDENIYSWLGSNTPLVICFINGFKPRGDDARPDRGLLPLARMLFGSNIDILALVFGQASAEMQEIFADNTFELASKNGLWKSVLYYSTLTIADSIHWTLPQSKISKFKLQNLNSTNEHDMDISFTSPQRLPIKFKENDIDTTIHLTFSSKDNIFESLCNPPGGDWSGISFLDNTNIEHRWMSLPRVSQDAKRPDHIFQIRDDADNYILIIESKEKLSGLLRDKDNLKNSLTKYVSDLIKYKSSAIKEDGIWKKNLKEYFSINVRKYFTAVAFFYNNDQELTKAIENLEIDFIIAFNITTHKVIYKYKTLDGKWLLEYLEIKGIIQLQ